MRLRILFTLKIALGLEIKEGQEEMIIIDDGGTY